MADNHSNQLTPGEQERLSILLEECGEVIQAIGKIQRHGYASGWNGVSNKTQLETELGDVLNALNMLCENQDISRTNVESRCKEKAGTITKYLHHQ